MTIWLLLAAVLLEKSYKSYLRGYLASKIIRFSETDYHRSTFWEHPKRDR